MLPNKELHTVIKLLEKLSYAYVLKMALQVGAALPVVSRGKGACVSVCEALTVGWHGLVELPDSYAISFGKAQTCKD